VNSISTPRGGTHVNYVADQIVKIACARMNRRHRGLQLQPNHVKQHLFLFVNCLVENPTFDSQTKETLTSKPKDFGSRCHISEAFVTRLMNRTRLEERILDWSAVRQKSELAQRAPRASRRVLGIPKVSSALSFSLILSDSLRFSHLSSLSLNITHYSLCSSLII
jgi:DNA topoisomerase II